MYISCIMNFMGHKAGKKVKISAKDVPRYRNSVIFSLLGHAGRRRRNVYRIQKTAEFQRLYDIAIKR